MPAIVIFDIDGVIRDVTNSYRRALADTVEHFTSYAFRPTMRNIDNLKAEGKWNNDWEGSQELIYRHYEEYENKSRKEISLDYDKIVEFFQSRYRGNQLDNPDKWEGYITTEPLLVDQNYFDILTENKLAWGFFSGATTGSAKYILEKRLGLDNPVLVAMEDAPGKPEPTGLFLAVKLVEERFSLVKDSFPVIYLGDTVADMTTIIKARKIQPEREFMAIGVLPPHVNYDDKVKDNYRRQLFKAGATHVVNQVSEFNSMGIIDN